MEKEIWVGVWAGEFGRKEWRRKEKKNEKGAEDWWLGLERWVGERGGSELGRRDQRGGGREENSREEWRSESVRREDQ